MMSIIINCTQFLVLIHCPLVYSAAGAQLEYWYRVTQVERRVKKSRGGAFVFTNDYLIALFNNLKMVTRGQVLQSNTPKQLTWVLVHFNGMRKNSQEDNRVFKALVFFVWRAWEVIFDLLRMNKKRGIVFGSGALSTCT